MNEIPIKPSNHIRKVWITSCPHCNYVLRFIAEVAKKEIKELEDNNIPSFNEFGTNYIYNTYSYPKPYMDYLDYLIEAITKIKAEIEKSLEALNINEWGLLCRGFLTENSIDPFKFLIRFYANFENYCNSLANNSKEKDMHRKIKESAFPQQLEDILEETRKLRNKVVHESYDLNEDDAELIKNVFLAFLSHLISSELAKLKLKSQVENIEYKFINKKSLLWDILKNQKRNWIKDGKVPLSILSAKDPKNPSKNYINSKEFEEWVNKFLEESVNKFDSEKSAFDVSNILTDILSYEFVFFTLSPNREIYDVCNIFARINQKGMKLSTFDLMNAFLYPKGVELRKDLWENLDNELLINIDSKMNEYLLKSISLFKQNYCSSKYIYNLIPEQKTKILENGKRKEKVYVKDGREFILLWKKACKFAEKAREKIMNTGPRDLGAIKHDFIPNTTIVPVLGTILWKFKGDPNSEDFNKLLQKWYWSSVLSEIYSGSSDSVMAKDYRDWIEYIKSGKELDLDSRLKTSIDNLDLKNTNKGSARYNAILCLLALKGAKDFYNGRAVGSGDFNDQNINDHHIFPLNVQNLDPSKSTLFNEYKNSIINRTLILDQTNQKIQNEKPSKYTDNIIKNFVNEELVKEIMETHFISEEAYNAMKLNDFDNFVKERKTTLENYIKYKLTT